MSFIIDSIVLHTTDVRETGLKLPGSFLLPFLKIGVTFASFQSIGTLPSSYDFLAAEGSNVNVIANDTDVLILLIAHFNIEMSDICMFTKADRNVYNIRHIVASLGQIAVKRLLTIHAFSGCDTTSGIYGHGKVSVFKKFVKARDVQPLFDVMESPSASHDEVMLSGCRLLSLLYSGSLNNQLNDLRYTIYMHMTATSSQLPKPERLPLTEK